MWASVFWTRLGFRALGGKRCKGLETMVVGSGLVVMFRHVIVGLRWIELTGLVDALFLLCTTVAPY